MLAASRRRLPDAAANVPRSSVLRQLGAELGLRSAGAALAQAERYTWEGERFPRAALDHILVSEELWPLVEEVRVGGGEVGERAASDHRPLWLTLKLAPQVASGTPSSSDRDSSEL
jgi:endonuclease/exonuclease/phosphatase family metal-dependent hydrolase